ncbi:hypothetical protein QTG54_007927 [Skeletonema marinoi]|uniref:Uncharacterized protein n=1 Tax=Skeletonema marinoi TaxID=267567 RepID=A0AAD9DCZ6_9STRA|nr:hypothetical protein QTG54_007927 [Skeletonema marinoi]
MDHFRFIFADIGATGAFGTPENDTLQKIPLSYQSAPLNDEMEAFDFYLIDGRYRVACACASMLHAMSRGGDMQKVMFGVHDYPGREGYHQLESVGDIVKESERLRVFQTTTQLSAKNVNFEKIGNAATVAAASVIATPFAALAADVVDDYEYGAVNAPGGLGLAAGLGVLAILTAAVPVLLAPGEDAFNEMKDKDADKWRK